MKIRYVVVIFFIAVLTFIGIFTYKLAKVIYTPVEIDHIMCEIAPGASGREIADTLFENNIILDKKLFHFIIRFKKYDTQLKSGRYLFTGNLTMLDTIEKLISGEIRVTRVTIPEGYSIYRTFKVLSENEIGDYERYLQLAQDPEFIKEAVGFEVTSLEGFLYPDTYILGMDMKEESVIRTMISNFYQRLDVAHIEIDDFEMFYKDLILASIVEQEAIYDDEKPRIAGVYHNRLKRNMRLQACPTATYHLEPQFPKRRVLTYTMASAKTPYNTYVINGLPPHPICSPSISSLFAVQNPDPTKALFFVADGRGRHHFSQTYEEHLRKQREMR